MKTLKKSIQTLLFLFLATIGMLISCNSSNNHEALRKSLKTGHMNQDGSIKDPSIQVVEEIPQGKRYGVCHNYAISVLLDLKGLIPEMLPIIGDGDWYDEFNFLDDYCQEVSTPEKNDLAIYKKSEQRPYIRHTGLVHDANTIESKWGICKPTAVLRHPPLTVPSGYGNTIKYYRLTTPKDIVIEDMKKKIARSQYTRKKCGIINDWLIYMTDNSWIDSLEESLEADMCANVNTINSEKQTLLMIAAKNNDLPIANLLLNYDAAADKQDTYGNTALILAAKNGSGAMMRALYRRGCNKNLKDNQGHDAFHYYRDYGSVCP